MVAFTTRMPAGIPGMVSRQEIATVEAAQIDSGSPPTAYGVPVVMDATAHQIRPVGGSDTTASVYGFLVRPFPTNSGTDPLGTSTPPTSGLCSVLRRGYMTVKLNAGTAAVGSQVYVRVAAPSGAKVVGGIEAAADSTNTITIPATFMGAADANGNVEISYNI